MIVEVTVSYIGVLVQRCSNSPVKSRVGVACSDLENAILGARVNARLGDWDHGS